MRVLLPTMRDPGQIGGTSTHLDMLADGLRAIGHEAEVLYLGGQLPAWAVKGGIVWPAGLLNRLWKGWGMMYSAMVRGRLLASFTQSELARGSWDVINAQEVYSVPGLRRAADEMGLPLVLTLHGYPLYESVSEGYTRRSRMGASYLMRSELRALRLADAVVTVDTRLYNHAVGLVPERTESVSALMNFIDTSAFVPGWEGREELRRQWDVPEGKTVLLCPRRLVKKNGVVHPAMALAAMPLETRRRFLLLHAGDGGERPAIEAVVREHGLGQEVRLLGGRDRKSIVELYRLADIVLVPSVHSENVEEATSLSALEAMASGRPLIAGAVGGLAEMVSEGETGLLFPGGDVRALAAAIVRLADDPGLGERLAENARAYVVRNHSHTTAARAYVDVYEAARRRVQARRGADADVRAAAETGEVAPGVAAAGSATVAGGTPPPRGAPASSTILVLGQPLDCVGMEEAVSRLLTAARSEAGHPDRTEVVISFNPELVMLARSEERVAQAMADADLRLPDGVGAVWAAGRLGAAGLERVPGIDLAERLVADAAREGLSVFFLGAEPGVAPEAARVLQTRYPGLVLAGTHHGYFSPSEEAAAVARVRQAAPALLLVALGAPRQELFLHDHRDELGARVALGVGGSFDVWAGKVQRAPEWAQRWKVEWLDRLARDPRRLRRQLTLPQFVAAVLTEAPQGFRSAGSQEKDSWDDLTEGRG